jgi:hypothetical protein
MLITVEQLGFSLRPLLHKREMIILTLVKQRTQRKGFVNYQLLSQLIRAKVILFINPILFSTRAGVRI